ncbi:MAG: hypothetical protein P4L84_01750 [Isosphaeraceae bacterium]|nr:hypothetical protein [Isosphaeraceae bacterium]
MRATLAIAALLAVIGTDRDSALESLGRMNHRAIREASGIIRSHRSPDVFWVLNDSGNPAMLFAVKRDGGFIGEFAVQAPNFDWEDFADDGNGRLYIGDIGNNDLRLPLRAIYRVDEPDPAKPAPGPLAVTAATYYRFAPGERFDAEGMYIDRGRAVLVAKYLDQRHADLFAVPVDPPAPLARPAVARRLGRLPGCTEPVTGAALSRDRRRLAVCSYNVLRIFERTDLNNDDWAKLAVVPFADQGRGIEAVCWDGADLVLAGEGRGLFRIAQATWMKTLGR